MVTCALGSPNAAGSAVMVFSLSLNVKPTYRGSSKAGEDGFDANLGTVLSRRRPVDVAAAHAAVAC